MLITRHSAGRLSKRFYTVHGFSSPCSPASPRLAGAATAQEDRPQITPGERPPAKKKDSGPRALAVLQLAANGKASLVPVAILVNGKFWDASEYKADPVPMALEPGTVYEAEQAGNSLGLFTVNSALHSNAVNVQIPWLGTGAWVPEGANTPKKAFKAEKAPIGLDPNDAPPRLTRRSSTSSDAPAASAPPSAPPQTTPPGSSAPSKTAPSPTNPSSTNPNQSAPSQTGSSPTASNSHAPNSSSTPTGNTRPPDSKPTDSKTADAKPATVAAAQSSTPTSDSGADESNRPRLRRGKPVDPLPEDDVPGYSKPGTTASATTAKPGDAAKPGSTPETNPPRLIPAISDAGGPQPKSFAFQWLKEEEGERLQQMTALATAQVRAYIVQQAKNKIPATPAPKPATSRTAHSTPKLKDPVLENVQMKAYDLWGYGQPILVFTADAHMPPPPAGAPHSADSDLQYSIVLVANPDIYNNLHKLFLAVTDKYHLDLTPQLQLVDAIDADGDGRGELLFRETSDNATGWILYRATADKLWKLFDSLNPE